MDNSPTVSSKNFAATRLSRRSPGTGVVRGPYNNPIRSSKDGSVASTSIAENPFERSESGPLGRGSPENKRPYEV